MTPAEKFFYEHAGYSYKPPETPEEGRVRCAKNYAACEALAREAGVSFSWTIDPITRSKDWGAEEDYEQWLCTAYDHTGKVAASIGGVDFGKGGTPWSEPYRRVLEAELAVQIVEESLEGL